MSSSVKIEEKRESYWKLVSVTSGILAVVLFLMYWNGQDVFWSGIFRLASFVLFAATVLSGLKAMEGNLSIEVWHNGKDLDLAFYKKGEKLFNESHKLRDIELISCLRQSSPLPFKRGKVFIICFRDSDQKYDLFHFGGRTLRFEDEEADKLIHFFKEQEIPVDDCRNT